MLSVIKAFKAPKGETGNLFQHGKVSDAGFE